jgi:D-threo-aldose 1-dehydrogenase
VKSPATNRTFGRAGFEVTVAGYGGSQVGNLSRALDDETAHALLLDGWTRGIRVYDTAPLYGHGLSEHRMGRALLHRPREEYVLSTKVGRRLFPAERGSFPSGPWVDPAPFRAEFDYSYDGVMRQVEDSLQRLCMDRIDILLIHDIDVRNHGPEGQPVRFREAMTGAYPALKKLRDEGVVRAIGVGVNEAEVCVAALREADLDCILLAGRYTLLEQDPLDDLLPLCTERRVAVILGGVFNSGVLAKGVAEGVRYNYAPAQPEILDTVGRLEAICARYRVPLSAAAVQFVAAHPAVANVCLGARTIAQQEANQASFVHLIPDAFWAELKQERLIRSDAPTPDQRKAD